MKIKEVEKLLQMNSQTIRYYDKLGFLNPKRDDNGYRNYTQEDIRILKKIRFLRELDISLDMIKTILNNQDEFQNILEQHIQSLQMQVENLEDIQRKCLHLSQKNVPLLDAVVDGEFQDRFSHENHQIKTLLQKATDFLQPYIVITIGRKTTPYQLLKEICLCFMAVSFVYLSFLTYLKTKNFLNFITWKISLINIIVLTIMIFCLIFKEKYYEFRNVDFYIFDSHKIKFKSLIAVFHNSTHRLARHYLYKDIDYVDISVKKRTGGIGFGPVTYYQMIYHFYMLDHNDFEINSSLYYKNDQDRKSVYEILEYHHVKIIDEKNIKAFLAQDSLSIYEYLEKMK